jgi:chorismate mutase/prephenate dehydratase
MSAPPDPTPQRDVSQLRAELDELDARSLELLARRRELVREVVRTKSADGKDVRDPLREEELLERLIGLGREQGLDAHFVTKVFREIIADSVRLQVEDLQRAAAPDGAENGVFRVAYQGGAGAYSELAAKAHFSRRTERLASKGFQSFAEAAQEVEEGRFDYAILPIENTTTGSINEVYDLLRSTSLSIVGEHRLKIEHCLISTKETPIEQITRISSHPQAILQCSDFLARLVDTEIDAYSDTALAVEHIKGLDDPTHAAIASAAAARSNDLVILSRDIANEAENYTRFVVVAREPEPLDPLVPARTSLVMSTGQKAGSLVEALLVFRDRGLALSKLENRPIPGRPFEEQFYVDFEGAQSDAAVLGALEDLTRVTRYLKVLGSYPRCDHEPSSPSARVVSELPSPTPELVSAEEMETPTPAVVSKNSSGWRLASREHKANDTVIQVGDHVIGGDIPTLIAGPCAVESAEQINICARIVKEAGAQILRGGVFKPRTSPYSFQGLGYEGLDLLVEAGRAHDLPIITEVLAPEDVEPVAARADVLQIGARNMQNFPLLKKVGTVDRPVMLKRGLMASIEELLQAAEYILSHGNQQVFLCERGIRTFETATRNTLDLGAIPILRNLTHLPVLVDPSHAAGRRDLVPPLVRAASAIGAQGIMVEIHPNPEEALSDGPQALRFPVFQELAREFFQT